MTTEQEGVSAAEHAEMRARLVAGAQRIRRPAIGRVVAAGVALVLVGGIVGVLGSTVGVTLGILPAPATHLVGSHFAIARPTDASPYDDGARFGDDQQDYESVLGTRILSASRDGRECLFVWVDYRSTTSYSTEGCVASGLTPIVDIVVEEPSDSTSSEDYVPTSEELLRAFTPGTTLRFTLLDGIVTVDVDSRGP